MHPRNTNNNFGYLSPHEQIFEVWDDEHMLLQESGNNPLWMTPQEREATKCSHFDEIPLKDKTRYELIGNLKRIGPAQDVHFALIIWYVLKTIYLS